MATVFDQLSDNDKKVVAEILNNANELARNITERCDKLLALTTNDEEDKHWQDVRERAAIAIMQGLLSDPSRTGSAEEYAEAAINYTDALIEELKKK